MADVTKVTRHKILALATIATVALAGILYSQINLVFAQSTNATANAANVTNNSAAPFRINTATNNATTTTPAATSVNNNTTTAQAQNASSGGALIGQISNVQLDNTTGKPAWVQSGIWVMRGSMSGSTPQVSQFYARFEMIKPDGTAMHRHLVYNFQQSNGTMQQSTISVNGTATVTMPQGPVSGVPVSIKVLNLKLIEVWIGPSKVNNHFGSEPVFGTVTTPIKSIMAEMNSAGRTNSTGSTP